MDYMYDGIDILDENLESARKRQMFRILVYYQRLCLYSGGTIAGEKKLDSNSLQTPLFWDQESGFGAEDIRKNEKMGNKTSHNGNCDMYNTRGNID